MKAASRSVTALAEQLPGRLRFHPISQPGFGDRHNSWAWAMCWWKGHLYVGTNRAFLCAERASIRAALPWLSRFPFVRYPPEDPDAECASDYTDLPLEAEIWRWSPDDGRWERVFRSPRDVPIPGHPGKYVARDIGFRDMIAFSEPDGMEALYVSGVNSRFIYSKYGRVPPPRLLRTTDGLHFEAVPQDPGTFFGDLDRSTLRTLAVYKGRLFVVAGAVQGDGVLLESDQPALGNDAFRQVSPEGMRVFEMVVYNGYLYLGLRDPQRGYAVVKTDAEGTPPYTFTPVVTDGAYLPRPSLSVISMYVFRDRLYVGTDRPAELIRIHPDDSWDLVIGTPRQTPTGWKEPISGLDAGFYNWLNGHLWRMVEYEGRLYIGTMNMSTHLRTIPEAERVLAPNYGFDLFESEDGVHFTPITFNGFGDMFNFGARTFAATPHGLFLGTANSWYGLQIWRGVSAARRFEDASEGHGEEASGDETVGWFPARLQAERVDRKVILSWEPAARARRYRIWRARVSDERRAVEQNPFLRRLLKIARAVLPTLQNVYLPPLPEKLWIPGAYEEVGSTDQTIFVDPSGGEGVFLYYIQAEGADGKALGCSNLVAVPSLAPRATFDRLMKAFDERMHGQDLEEDALRDAIERARAAALAGDVSEADRILGEIMQGLTEGRFGVGDPIALEDIALLVSRLRRRLSLIESGWISLEAL
ncbi:MAG TPA: hypothetical protein G4O02_01985 [Caldilineae bacterium]|nr:hypothetical protein [Caldilineae bacterium]